MMVFSLFSRETGMRIIIGLSGFLLGLFGCALLAIIEFGAWALILPPRVQREDDPNEPPETPDAGAGDRAVAISTVASDGARLAGLWHPANSDEQTGRIALLLHGFAEAADALQAQRVDALNRDGWNVAALDLRGYGRSDGPFASFGGREAGDTRTWLDTLTDRVGPKRLEPVLWGRSMGAAIALRAAAEDPRIKALVLESPMIDLDEAMAVWFRKRRFPFPLLLARLVTRRASKIAGVSLTRPQPLELAPRVRCPVLIVHGSADNLVTSEQARRLAGALPTPPRFIEVPEAGHTDVVAIGGEALLAQMTMFLQQIAV